MVGPTSVRTVLWKKKKKKKVNKRALLTVVPTCGPKAAQCGPQCGPQGGGGGLVEAQGGGAGARLPGALREEGGALGGGAEGGGAVEGAAAQRAAGAPLLLLLLGLHAAEGPVSPAPEATPAPVGRGGGRCDWTETAININVTDATAQKAGLRRFHVSHETHFYYTDSSCAKNMYCAFP